VVLKRKKPKRKKANNRKYEKGVELMEECSG
jgi:hypothetical protein